jgi:hypothetical protein
LGVTLYKTLVLMEFSLANMHASRNHVVIGAPRSGKTDLVRFIYNHQPVAFGTGGLIVDDAGARRMTVSPKQEIVRVLEEHDIIDMFACANERTRPLVLDDVPNVNEHANLVMDAMVYSRSANVSVIVSTTYDFDERITQCADLVYLLPVHTGSNIRRAYKFVAKKFFPSYEAFETTFKSIVRDTGDCMVIEVATGDVAVFNSKLWLKCDPENLLRASCSWMENVLNGMSMCPAFMDGAHLVNIIKLREGDMVSM